MRLSRALTVCLISGSVLVAAACASPTSQEGDGIEAGTSAATSRVDTTFRREFPATSTSRKQAVSPPATPTSSTSGVVSSNSEVATAPRPPAAAMDQLCRDVSETWLEYVKNTQGATPDQTSAADSGYANDLESAVLKFARSWQAATPERVASGLKQSLDAPRPDNSTASIPGSKPNAEDLKSNARSYASIMVWSMAVGNILLGDIVDDGSFTKAIEADAVVRYRSFIEALVEAESCDAPTDTVPWVRPTLLGEGGGVFGQKNQTLAGVNPVLLAAGEMFGAPDDDSWWFDPSAPPAGFDCKPFDPGIESEERWIRWGGLAVGFRRGPARHGGGLDTFIQDFYWSASIEGYASADFAIFPGVTPKTGIEAALRITPNLESADNGAATYFDVKLWPYPPGDFVDFIGDTPAMEYGEPDPLDSHCHPTSYPQLPG